jgi:hypothetical protein
MTRTETILAAALTLLIALAGAGGFLLWQTWKSASADLVKMQATLAGQQKIIAESNLRLAQAQTELAAKLKDIETLRRTVVTPVQIIREIPQQIPGVQPVIVQPPATVDQPAPPAVAQIPIDQLKPLFDFALACKDSQANLTGCQAEVKELGVQIEAVKVQRDVAVQTAKGGSRWSKVKSGLKWAAGGVVAGVVFGLAAR